MSRESLCGLKLEQIGRKKKRRADKKPFRALEVFPLSPQFLCEDGDLYFIKIS